MLRFFRQIRKTLMEQNKVRSYLFYAIGEILLVVIGILIALQVNNWNEQRKLSQELDSYARAITLDLENDISALDISIHQAKISQILLDSLISYSRSLQNIDEVRNIDLFLLSRRSSYRAIAWSRSTLQELKSSGALRYVQNDSLLNLLNRYEAFTYHLDTDYIDDEEATAAFTGAIRKVVDNNYPSDSKLMPGWFELPADRFPDFNSFEDYDKLRENDLDLLTDNLNDIKVAVNHAINLKGQFQIRTETEFPNAKEMALQTIDLLQQEYGIKK